MQQKLRHNGREHRTKKRSTRRCPVLLEGLVFCHQCGASLSHTYASKGSRRYRYYSCSTALRRGREQCNGKILPAAEFESLVVAELKAAQRLDDSWETLTSDERRARIQERVQKIAFDSEQQELCVTLAPIESGISGQTSEKCSDTSGQGQCEIISRRAVFTTPRRSQETDSETLVDPLKRHVPRVARLMALSIRMKGLIQSRQVTDYAQLARLGHVSRARITQILNLNLLAPDIQEAILYLPKLPPGRDPISEKHLRSIVQEPDWNRQREHWSRLYPASSDEV